MMTMYFICVSVHWVLVWLSVVAYTMYAKLRSRRWRLPARVRSFH